MPFPPAHLITLADVAHRIPAASWLAAAVQQDAHHWGSMPVWWVDGDLTLAALDLCALAHPDRPGEWIAPFPAGALTAVEPHPGGALLWVNGNLQIQGALTSRWPQATMEAPSIAVHALVMGNVHIGSAALHGVRIHVQESLQADHLLWCDGAGAALTVLGQCSAQVGLFTNGSETRWNKPPHFDFELRDRAGSPPSELLAMLLQPHCIAADAIDSKNLADMLDVKALLSAIQSGQGITADTAQVRTLLPQAPTPDLFTDDAITAANILAAVRSPVIAHKEHTAEGWFGQTDFSLCRQHVDADGDARDNSVFITVWKQWDFYLAVDNPDRRRGWLGTAWSSLQGMLNRTKRHSESASAFASAAASTASEKAASAGPLTLLYRPYHLGEPGDWRALVPPTSANATGISDTNALAWQACQQAWRGVLDYVRKGTAQARARYPLWAQLQAEITPARLEALTSGPLFTEQYNDWWDAERNGFWAGQLWIGARQPCLHEGEPWGRAFKLSWQNGEDGPGDLPDDAHAAYQLDLDEAREGPPQVLVQYTQRQSASRSPVPPCAADHLARLLRLYRQAQAHIESRTAALASSSPPVGPPPLPLLATPPLPHNLPDTAVFGPEGMECSSQWQSLGQDHVRMLRAQLLGQQSAAATAVSQGNASATDRPAVAVSPFHLADDTPDLPEDPRTPWADAVLQLARAVHRHADWDLSARFRQRFAFAPDALAAHAYRAGQATGPALLLDAGLDDTAGGAPARGRVLVRTYKAAQSQGAEHAAAEPQWWLIQGLQAHHLPDLHGAGRSANRQCFARCDGTRITTHGGWDGPVLAEFALPQGHEGTPTIWGLAATAEGQVCDELIPFNDGQRVLLRNRTGVYLLTPDAVQRLHPLQWDEDGPYTWGKNRHTHAKTTHAQTQADGTSLRLHMVHMALSADEQYIAVGDQDSAHTVVDARALGQAKLRVVARYAPLSAYACHATFTQAPSTQASSMQASSTHSSPTLLASACHLYSGSTGLAHLQNVGRHVAHTPSLNPAEPPTEPGQREQSDPDLQAIQTQWRIEASAAVPGLVVLGDASGTLHGLDESGHVLWHHHIGGAVATIDLAPDGSTLIAATQSGYLVLLQRVDTGPDPYALGNSDYAEVGRWLFWRSEPVPLHW